MYPLGTLELPYFCGNLSCACHEASAYYTSEGKRLAVRRAHGRWTVEVREDGWIVDSFTEYELNDALEQVHREYPGIPFNPED